MRHSLTARHIQVVLPGDRRSGACKLQSVRALIGPMYKERYGWEHRLFKSAVPNHHGIDSLQQEKCILSWLAGQKLGLKLPGTALPQGAQREILSGSSSCWHHWTLDVLDSMTLSLQALSSRYLLPCPHHQSESPLTFSL